MECDLRYISQINPFFLKLLSAKVFYHCKRNLTKTMWKDKIISGIINTFQSLEIILFKALPQSRTRAHYFKLLLYSNAIYYDPLSNAVDMKDGYLALSFWHI